MKTIATLPTDFVLLLEFGHVQSTARTRKEYTVTGRALGCQALKRPRTAPRRGTSFRGRLQTHRLRNQKERSKLGGSWRRVCSCLF